MKINTKRFTLLTIGTEKEKKGKIKLKYFDYVSHCGFRFRSNFWFKFRKKKSILSVVLRDEILF